MARRYAPEKIASVQFDKLTQPEQRVLLHYMGCDRAPSKQPDRVAMLKEMRANNEARMQAGYDIIVRHKMPELTKEVKDSNEYRWVEAKFYELMTQITNADLETKIGARVKELSQHVEKMADKAITAAANDYRPIVIKQGRKKRVVKGVLPDEFQRMVELGAARVNIMLVGPAGCGKTYLAARLAEALDLPYADQSMSEGVTEAELVGRLLPIGKGGAFQHVPAPFLDIYENGGVFLFDEMDNSDANMLVFINKALANDRIFVPQRHENPEVRKHKDFVAIGAMNTYGTGADMMYVGRNALDAATLDRFRAGMINMDYSVKVERSLGDTNVVAWAHKVRAAIRKHKLSRIMSTRTIIDLTKMVESAGWKQDQWNEAYFADWDDNERALVLPELKTPAVDLSGITRMDGGN